MQPDLSSIPCFSTCWHCTFVNV